MRVYTMGTINSNNDRYDDYERLDNDDGSIEVCADSNDNVSSTTVNVPANIDTTSVEYVTSNVIPNNFSVASENYDGPTKLIETASKLVLVPDLKQLNIKVDSKNENKITVTAQYNRNHKANITITAKAEKSKDFSSGKLEFTNVKLGDNFSEMADRIDKLRSEGKTQQETAIIIGCSQSTISRIENSNKSKKNKPQK